MVFLVLVQVHLKSQESADRDVAYRNVILKKFETKLVQTSFSRRNYFILFLAYECRRIWNGT